MASGKNTMDSPVPEKGLFSPKGAEKLPIKHYPGSTKIATEGKKTTIDGPCNDCKK